jgi:hypothetical protein
MHPVEKINYRNNESELGIVIDIQNQENVAKRDSAIPEETKTTFPETSIRQFVR